MCTYGVNNQLNSTRKKVVRELKMVNGVCKGHLRMLVVQFLFFFLFLCPALIPALVQLVDNRVRLGGGGDCIC